MSTPAAPPPECDHQHLGFKHYGRIIQCIDCPRKWYIENAIGQPDMTYMNPRLNDFETRHGRFALARIAPAVKPPTK